MLKKYLVVKRLVIKDFAISASIAAAAAAMSWIGKGDKFSADLACVKAMEQFFSQNNFPAVVSIGEGERDKAPMLFTGQRFGNHHKYDIAVDPLEGTNLCAEGKAGAITVISIAEKGIFFPCPDIYMHKIAINLPYLPDDITMDTKFEDILLAASRALSKPLHDLRVIILDRQRHEEYINIAKNLGCKLQTIEDGDVVAALSCSKFIDKADVYYGIGGAPEGVIAAAAMAPLGGIFTGRLAPSNEEQIARLNHFDFSHDHLFLSANYQNKNIVTCLTGVTDGELLAGVQLKNGQYHCHSLIIENAKNSASFANHNF